MKVIAVALALMVASSCRKQVDTRLIGSEVPENASFTIKVVNNNRLDVVLYIVHDAHRERLGNATAATTTDFEFRLRRLGAGREFRLQADPIGSATPVRTESFLARDAMLLTWTLESDFKRSSVTVF
jgi:hypothetical protein